MALIQHTSVLSALDFDEVGIVHSALKTKNGNPKTPKDHRAACALARGYIITVANILDKPRTGWTVSERNVDAPYRETIGAHMVKVALGVWYLVEGLIVWHQNRGETPSSELRELYLQVHRRLHLVRKGFFHDFCEWGEYRDYRPGEISKREKRKREIEALHDYHERSGDDYPLSMFLSLDEPNLENELLDNVDKTDPAIMALNYQRELREAEVSEFFRSSFDRITIPLVRESLETLIRYRDEYPRDIFLQYLLLLRHGGNIDAWRRTMESQSSKEMNRIESSSGALRS